jgi:pilus assembly protein CpaF
VEVVVKGPNIDERIPVQIQERIAIGRDPSCRVVLEDLDVSRTHLVIEPLATGWLVRDQSSNGTYVGQRFLRQDATICGDREGLQIGPYAIALRRGEPEPPIDSAASEVAAGNQTERHDAVSVELRRKIHRRLLDSLNLAQLDRNRLNDEALWEQVRQALQGLVAEHAGELPHGASQERLVEELANEALGLGPLEELLADDAVSEVMVVDPHTIYCERKGKLELTALRFTDNDSARSAIERIVTPLGRRIDESNPYVDARLKDGSRVNAVIPPLALRGACITIRKFQKKRLGMIDLIGFGSLNQQMGRFLERTVRARKNVVISGGTGSGKTTLLNVLSAAIPEEERIVTIEDAAELQLDQEHVVSLESRPPNMEGNGAIGIRDLVRNALRMRPDRIIVGECRGGEAIDMLQAMNTGHDGSMTTTHANSPAEAIGRLETLALMAGLDLPSRAIREQIAASVDVIVQQTRLSDGSRRVTSIAEVVGIDDAGRVEVQEIFEFWRTGTDESGRAVGYYQATGYLPTYLGEMIRMGLVEGDEYL